jgi:hypothetical protein
MSDKVKDMIFDPGFGKTFQPRQPEDFRMDFQLTIYAVGTTVENALEALKTTLGWGKITDIEFQSVRVPVEWYVRFHAGGTSMKAAGHYLTGGVIVTWWK